MSLESNLPVCRPVTPPSSKPADAVCAECGADGAADFGHVQLCADCYAVKGACCALEGRETEQA